MLRGNLNEVENSSAAPVGGSLPAAPPGALPLRCPTRVLRCPHALHTSLLPTYLPLPRPPQPTHHPAHNRSEAGGVEAALALLQAARRKQPVLKELPRHEEAAEAAATALHALLVLLTGGGVRRRAGVSRRMLGGWKFEVKEATSWGVPARSVCPSAACVCHSHSPLLLLMFNTGNRRNRGRLQRAGGAAELAAAFQDERLGWEVREQAAGLLQDLASALPQDGAADEDLADATPASGSGSGQRPVAALEEWRRVLLPALVVVLQQKRGQQLQDSKEAAAGVLARLAAHGQQYAAAVE